MSLKDDAVELQVTPTHSAVSSSLNLSSMRIEYEVPPRPLLPLFLQDQNQTLDSLGTVESGVQTPRPLEQATSSRNLMERIQNDEVLEENNERDNDDINENELWQEFTDQVSVLVRAVICTFILTCWWVHATIHALNSPGIIYTPKSSDSSASVASGSLLNALILVGGIIIVTLLFVVLFKYKCYFIMYAWLGLSVLVICGLNGTLLLMSLLERYNLLLDWISLSYLMWNFSAVAVLVVFYQSPLWLRQATLVVMSALLATNLTRLPEWTVWALLGLVSVYDIFAVLCPGGPLKMLVQTAQDRQTTIPALLFTATMANRETEFRPTELPRATSRLSAHSRDALLNEITPQQQEEQKEGIKLGLGDFIFYSVLIGRATLTDWLTVLTCSVSLLFV